jgi:diguanylate cyclase (GGDEF)-like protein
MSVLPLLVCIYLIINYTSLTNAAAKFRITLPMLITAIIALFGFFITKEIFDRLVSVSSGAKLIASGDTNHKVGVDLPDEVGDLGEVLNKLSQHIRNNMEELKSYSERTTELNLEIQRRVLVLSSLLQISSLISEGVKLEEILKIILEKSRLLANSDVTYLLLKEDEGDTFTMKMVDGIESGYLLKIKIEPQEAMFNKIIKTNRPFILDKENIPPEDLREAFYDKFRLKNTLAFPVSLRGDTVGILGLGSSRDPFLYSRDDMDLLNIFAKQIAIAIENDALIHRVEKLEIKDVLTGLYNKPFIHSRLQEEIKRAIVYHRPCAFLLLDIDNFQDFRQAFGSLQAEVTLKKISSLIRNSVTEIDRVARTGDNEFSIILPERNKRQAQKIAEDIRGKLEFAFKEEQNVNKRLTLSGGVSENPLDGITSEELVNKAKELLNLAKAQGKNRILGFTEKPICQ